MSITERLANLSTPTVIITVLVLFAIRYLLLKYYKTPIGKSIAETAESLGVAMAPPTTMITMAQRRPRASVRQSSAPVAHSPKRKTGNSKDTPNTMRKRSAKFR